MMRAKPSQRNGRVKGGKQKGTRSGGPTNVGRRPRIWTDAEEEIEPFAPYAQRYLNRLQKDFSFKGFTEETEFRTIAIADIVKLSEYAMMWMSGEEETKGDCWCELSGEGGSCSGPPLTTGSLNFYHLDSWLVRPATDLHRQGGARNGCSFSELLSATPPTPRWFISHWWSDRLFDFVKCVEAQAKFRGLPGSTGMWCWQMARRPHCLDEVVYEHPSLMSFGRAIRQCEGFLLILSGKYDKTSSASTTFSRLWCMLETYTALNTDDLLIDLATRRGLEAQVLTDGLTAAELIQDEESPGKGRQAKTTRESSFPISVLEEALHFEVSLGKATSRSDQAYIMNCFANRNARTAPPLQQHPNYSLVSWKLRSSFAAILWRLALENNAVESMALWQVLRGDKGRKQLRLDFSFSQLNGLGMYSLTKALRTGLRVLSLELCECSGVGDEAMALLGEYLPNLLQSLYLNCSMCSSLTDAGVAALAVGFPESLQSLTLDLSLCPRIGDGALAALAKLIPLGLQMMDLRFAECTGLTDAGLACLARCNAVVLQKLRLDLRRCEQITSEGLTALAWGSADRSEEPEVQLWAARQAAAVGKRKLVLQFALPRTLMTWDIAGRKTTEAELNAALTEMSWGQATASGWTLEFEEPTLRSPDALLGLVTYGDFLRKFLMPDIQKIEALQAVFTNPNEPGAKMRPFLNKMVSTLAHTSNFTLCKAYDIQKVTLNEVDGVEDAKEPQQATMRYGRHQVLPAFWKLLIHLTQTKRDFSLVFRSYSYQQLEAFQREMNLFCCGRHPAYSGLHHTKMPPRMSGERGSQNLQLSTTYIGRMNRGAGELKFVKVAAALPRQPRTPRKSSSAGSESVLSESDSYEDEEGEDDEEEEAVEGNSSRRKDEEDDAANKQGKGRISGESNRRDGKEDGKSVSNSESVVPQSKLEGVSMRFPPWTDPFHSLLHNVYNVCQCVGIIDDYVFWETNQRKSTAAKLHLVDFNGCVADTEVQNIFFDGNILGSDSYSVDVRDITEGEPLSVQDVENLFVHRVDLYQACIDQDYFIKALDTCEKKMTAASGPQFGTVKEGSGLPLCELELTLDQCIDVGQGGIAAFAEALPSTMQILTLNFCELPKFSDGGLSALARHLPKQLRELSLDLSRCSHISCAGVGALAAHLPKTLRKFKLNLERCYGVKDNSLILLRRALPPSLEVFELTTTYTGISAEMQEVCKRSEDFLAWEPPTYDIQLSLAPPSEPSGSVQSAAVAARPATMSDKFLEAAGVTAPAPRGETPLENQQRNKNRRKFASTVALPAPEDRSEALRAAAHHGWAIAKAVARLYMASIPAREASLRAFNYDFEAESEATDTFSELETGSVLDVIASQVPGSASGAILGERPGRVGGTVVSRGTRVGNHWQMRPRRTMAVGPRPTFLASGQSPTGSVLSSPGGGAISTPSMVPRKTLGVLVQASPTAFTPGASPQSTANSSTLGGLLQAPCKRGFRRPPEDAQAAITPSESATAATSAAGASSSESSLPAISGGSTSNSGESHRSHRLLITDGDCDDFSFGGDGDFPGPDDDLDYDLDPYPYQAQDPDFLVVNGSFKNPSNRDAYAVGPGPGSGESRYARARAGGVQVEPAKTLQLPPLSLGKKADRQMAPFSARLAQLKEGDSPRSAAPPDQEPGISPLQSLPGDSSLGGSMSASTSPVLWRKSRIRHSVVGSGGHHHTQLKRGFFLKPTHQDVPRLSLGGSQVPAALPQIVQSARF